MAAAGGEHTCTANKDCRQSPARRQRRLPAIGDSGKRAGGLRALVCLCALWAAGAAEAFTCAESLARPAAKPAQRRFAVTQAEPARGTVHALTVFARFADQGGRALLPRWTQTLYDPDRTGSLAHYFREMSHGQFSLEGTVLPRWFVGKQPAAGYLRGEGEVGVHGRFGVFAREIFDRVDDEIDYGLFDNDGPDGVPNSGDDDGYVDYFFLNTQSVPTGFIVGTSTGIARLGLGDDYVTGDRSAAGGFVKIRSDSHPGGPGGALQQARNFAEAAGTMAHEFGHAFGLPDLFDQESLGDNIDVDDSAGIGYWGVMGHGNRGWRDLGGPNPFCLWSLEELGWIGVDNGQLVVVEGSLRNVVFADMRRGGKVYKLPSRTPDLYYLVGYRTPANSYYERDLPGDGLVVWRVDLRRHTNEDEQAKLVDLVAADGLYADRGFPAGRQADPQFGFDNLDFWAHDRAYLRGHAGNLGDATDLFDGRRYTDFSVLSNPAAPPGVSVANIRREGGRVVADLSAADRRWAGVIAADAVWSDTVDVVGDVRVAKQAALRVLPGTVVRFGPDRLRAGLDAERSELAVEGRLRVEARAAGATGAAVFTSAQARPAPGDWYGIVASAQAEIDIENARIEYPRIGLRGVDTRKRIEMADVQIFDAAEYGVHAEPLRHQLYLTRLEVRRSGRSGVYAQGAGAVRLGKVLLADNARYGVEAHHSALHCFDSDLVDNGAGGQGANIALTGGSGQILDNRIAGGVGVELAAAGQVSILRNRFENNRIGIVVRDASPEIARNAFVGSDLVLRVEGAAVPARLELNAAEGARNLLDNRAAAEVAARNNWWGLENAELIAAGMRGPVAWEPYLAVDPRRPLAFALRQSYPNPFNGQALIRYSVGVDLATYAESMALAVYAPSGQRVRVLRSGRPVAGEFAAVWDGRDQSGRRVASGLYFYQLRVGARRVVKKMLFLQ